MKQSQFGFDSYSKGKSGVQKKEAAGKKKFKPAPNTICKHAPHRLYSWTVDDPRYEKPVTCVVCCDCGEALAGGVD